MKKLFAAAVLIWLAVSASASAQIKVFNTGNDLANNCAELDESSYPSGYCMGFIGSVADIIGNFEIFGWKACLPAQVTKGQVVDVVRQFLNDNPQDLHLAAAGLVARALAEAFPCE